VIPLEEAQQFILANLVPLQPAELSLADALGCVAATELRAVERVPGFCNSAMDGYALRAADTSSGSARLRVTGSVFAGDVPSRRVEAGDAMRITTGAPLPDGADCICKVEEVTVVSDGQNVLIDRVVQVGEHVRYPGEDIAKGQVLSASGHELGPTELGVLASQGFTSVLVYLQPRVGVLSTGNELVDSPVPLQVGTIRDVNRPMLLALLRQSGFTPIDLGIARDDQTEIAERLRETVIQCDAVVTTGGVSVGDVDHVKTVIGDLCGERARWMQVAIKPGKPLAFGVTGPRATPLFGLAGNPVSTRVGFELYVRPALRLLAGHQSLERLTLNMMLDCPLPRQRDGKLHIVHAVASFHDDGRMHVESVTRQGPHLLSAICGANVVAMLPDGDGLDIGEVVRGMVLDAAPFVTTGCLPS
jgi:molybdopterin molybdotransferase